MARANKQSSSAVSSIAGKYVRMTNDSFDDIIFAFNQSFTALNPRRHALFRDIRKLAASVLSQDESKGQKRRTKTK